MTSIQNNIDKIFEGNKGCAPMNHIAINQTWKRSGAYGNVRRAKLTDKSKKFIAMKEMKVPKRNPELGELAEMEYKIARKLKDFDIPKVYKYVKCPIEGNGPNLRKDILYFEYVDGVSLREYIQTRRDLTLDQLKSIVVQVCYNLYKIHKKFPSFRHHDLHTDNILIRTVAKKNLSIEVGDTKYTIDNGGLELVMIDFGFASFPGIPNPLVNKKNYINIGIHRNSNKYYDLHYFLNSMYNEISSSTRKTPMLANHWPRVNMKMFIGGLFMNDYLGSSSSKIKNYRLRGTTNNSRNKDLPSFEKVLTHPFLSGIKKPRMEIPVARKANTPTTIVRKTPPRNNQTTTASQRRNAINRAKKILQNGKQVSKTTMRPSIARKKPPLPPKAPKAPSPPKPVNGNNNKQPILTKPTTSAGMTKSKKPSTRTPSGKKNKVSQAWINSFMKNMTRN
jgi:tRNA A-37 threonylcarbamoyl transferase component Bud32